MSDRLKSLGVIVCIALIPIIILIIATEPGCGCSWLDRYNRRQKQHIRKNLTYIKDKRTGLCYVVWDYSGVGLAVVPCDKVKDHLE